MSKKTKLYIKVNQTLLRVENIDSIKSIIPDSRDIIEHFNVCGHIGKFSPIEIEVNEREFDSMLKDIRKKLGMDIGGSSIPIVLSSDIQPIIRITKNK